MDVAALLAELYGRIPPLARDAVQGVDVARLREAPAEDANPIAWLVWHVARVLDSHIAELVDAEELWTSGDWAARFGLDPDPANTGYGHGPAEVAAVRPDGPQALLDYLDAAMAVANDYLADVTARSLDRIVDRRWNPPVTLGVRLVSVADDCLQHLGQAGYVRGLLDA
jgi:hypothetical protein